MLQYHNLALYLTLSLFSNTLWASIGLEVTTSSNPLSDENRSFIYVLNPNKTIMQGVKIGAEQSILSPPIPFKFELRDPIDNSHFLQWSIRTKDKAYGRFNIVSKFNGAYKKVTPGRLWRSTKLSGGIQNRHILEFRPKPQEHQPPLYKKGRAKNEQRRKYGGGTKIFDDYIYNPRLSYEVSVSIYKNKQLVQTYTENIAQDDKDLLRQEYINHYGRKRYGRGKAGEIPVPMRAELSLKPEPIKSFAGGSITSSNYGVLIEDGMLQLANKVAESFEQAKQMIKNDELKFVDLNNDPLYVSPNKMWLSSGWRNPERNEWYSNAINGIHQRGAALDLIPNEKPGSKKAAATYWLIWKTLNNKSFNIPGYWQLETHGRPMKTIEYKQDVSPKNGIPDAFDIADHLHIQLEAYP